VVKHALGHRAARALSPEAARARIRDTAEQAVRQPDGCAPLVIPAPYRLEIDLTSVALADLAATIPVAERTAPRRVAFAAENIAAVIGWVNTISAMSAMLR
jgi:D-amino peptidase